MPHHGKDEGADRIPAVLSTLNLSLALSAKLLLLQQLWCTGARFAASGTLLPGRRCNIWQLSLAAGVPLQ